MQLAGRSWEQAHSRGAAWTACNAPEAEAPAESGQPSSLGTPVRRYGQRSPHENGCPGGLRESKTPEAASSRTPLDQTYGIITPSALHFERHHAGVPEIDPATHKLLIHGLVDRPMAFYR